MKRRKETAGACLVRQMKRGGDTSILPRLGGEKEGGAASATVTRETTDPLSPVRREKGKTCELLRAIEHEKKKEKTEGVSFSKGEGRKKKKSTLLSRKRCDQDPRAFFFSRRNSVTYPTCQGKKDGGTRGQFRAGEEEKRRKIPKKAFVASMKGGQSLERLPNAPHA